MYRVLGESAAQSRLDAAGITDLTPLVGRDAELALLRERWAQSREGAGQVVLLRGEAGIGKSRLVEMLREHARSEGATRIVFRCLPYYQNSALYPLIDYLRRLLQGQRDEAPEAKLDSLERLLRTCRLPLDEAMPLLAALLSLPLPEPYRPLTLTPQRQRQKTLDVLVAWLLAEAERQPVLAVWEDLHWADPSTLEVLRLLLDQAPTTRTLVLLTCRPEFRPPWATHAAVTQITLGRLGRGHVATMIAGLTDAKTLPTEVVEQVIAKTDGVPLFIEELVKMILGSGLVRELAGRYVLTDPLPPLAIPSSLHDSLMARLDRLSTARVLAQVGAVLGREFTHELLQAIAPVDERTLEEGLARLVDAELVYQSRPRAAAIPPAWRQAGPRSRSICRRRSLGSVLPARICASARSTAASRGPPCLTRSQGRRLALVHLAVPNVSFVAQKWKGNSFPKTWAHPRETPGYHRGYLPNGPRRAAGNHGCAARRRGGAVGRLSVPRVSCYSRLI